MWPCYLASKPKPNKTTWDVDSGGTAVQALPEMLKCSQPLVPRLLLLGTHMIDSEAELWAGPCIGSWSRPSWRLPCYLANKTWV